MLTAMGCLAAGATAATGAADWSVTYGRDRRLALVHGASSEVKALEDLVKDIQIEFPLIIADMGPTVGTHGGPGIIGLAWVEA